MELNIRKGNDKFVPAGAYRALEARLRERSAELAEVPTAVLACFDRSTRLLPFVLYDTMIFPSGARNVAGALYQAGFTPRQLRADQQAELLRHRLGITNLVDRGTARADELTTADLVAGAERLQALVGRYRPGWLAVLGVTAYRAAFSVRRANVGRQPGRLGSAGVWVLPNPSGLNAHFSVEQLAAEFRKLHEAVMP